MTYVVTAPCFGCKHTACVAVCPADCFREGESMLYIDPDSCLDCSACAAECPTEAIYHEDDVPEPWRDFIELNREMSQNAPLITEQKEPLANG